MEKPQDLAATRSSRCGVVYAAVAICFCLAMSVATAYASEPGGTGTVACKVTYPDGTGANIQYPVEFSFPGALTVAGRWGQGNDVTYLGQGTADNPSGRQLTLYLYSMSDPNNPETFEQLYSETGKLDVNVNKNGEFHITGKSFVVMDFNFTSERLRLGAECTWKLSGSGTFG